MDDVNVVLHKAITFACDVTGVNAYAAFWPLACTAAAMIQEWDDAVKVNGGPVEGLQFKSLCERARVTRSHLDAHFSEAWLIAADIAVRAILFLDGIRTPYTQIFSVPALTRKDNVSLGVDLLPWTTPSLRLIGSALSGPDRVTASFEQSLTTGTADDHSCERANLERIESFEDELDMALSGPPHEHIDDVLSFEARCVSALQEAAAARPEMFLAHLGVTARTFIPATYPRLTLIGELPTGTPTKQGRLFERMTMLGDDAKTLTLLRRAKRRAIVLRELDPARPRVSVAELQRQGWRLLDPPPPNDPLHVYLEVGTFAYGVEWWHHQRDELLMRKTPIAGGDSARAVRVEEWRLVNLNTQTYLNAAMTLIERHSDPWLRECLRAAAEQTGPGLLHARKPSQLAGGRAILRVARAGLVSAERTARDRRVPRR